MKKHEIEAPPEPVRADGNDDHSSIAALAYQLWLSRGCPIGSDQDDWYLAESMLKRQQQDEEPSLSE